MHNRRASTQEPRYTDANSAKTVAGLQPSTDSPVRSEALRPASGVTVHGVTPIWSTTPQVFNWPSDPEGISRLESSSHFVLHTEPPCSEPIQEVADIEYLEDVHTMLKQAWEASSERLRFCKAITKAMENESLRITSCMGLGLGSFCSSMQPIEQSAKHMNQLIAFEISIDMLKKKHTISQIYFQDPLFNAVDRAFLESRGYTVLDSPASNSVLNEETYLFMPFLPWMVALATLRECHPMLVLGNHFECWAQDCFGRFIESHTVLKKFVDSREKIDVPFCSPVGQLLTLFYPSP